jgi:hypothetical protein
MSRHVEPRRWCSCAPAYQMSAAIRMQAFAERARRERAATGETPGTQGGRSTAMATTAPCAKPPVARPRMSAIRNKNTPRMIICSDSRLNPSMAVLLFIGGSEPAPVGARWVCDGAKAR